MICAVVEKWFCDRKFKLCEFMQDLRSLHDIRYPLILVREINSETEWEATIDSQCVWLLKRCPTRYVLRVPHTKTKFLYCDPDLFLKLDEILR